MIALGITLFVFCVAASYEWCAVRYLAAQDAKLAARAANWGTLQAAIGLVSISSVLQVSNWLAIPELAGVWLGIHEAIRRRTP